MRHAFLVSLVAIVGLVCCGAAAAQQPRSTDLRWHIESYTAVLDSHARRLYYEVREQAESDDEQDELLEEVRELWNATRRASNRAMDGASAEKLEREISRVEKAFHRVEQHHQWAGQQHQKRVARIDRLVHSTHDRVHKLLALETTPQHNHVVPYRGDGSRVIVDGSRATEIERRASDAARRAVDDQLPSPLRIGPDGLYIDGNRLPIPFGR